MADPRQLQAELLRAQDPMDAYRRLAGEAEARATPRYVPD